MNTTTQLWGFWTKGKLDILRRYLDAFTTTTKYKSPKERIYIDAFAGVPENRETLTDELLEGSATIALSIDDPPFTRLRFFEIVKRAPELEAYLRSRFPNRDLQVYGGDCNDLIPVALGNLQHLDWAPTFAFVDPNALEVEWRTLQALADFKKHSKYKVELFLLFAAPMFMRLLPVSVSVRVREADIGKIDRFFGIDDWRYVYDARRRLTIEPSQARVEYLNLMRWRLEKVLGYRWTHPMEVRNEQGSPIYYMIFATDNSAGDRIMRGVYAQAAAEFPQMREEARRLRRQLEDRNKGLVSLFADDVDDSLWAPVQRGERFYEHDVPWEPDPTRFLGS